MVRTGDAELRAGRARSSAQRSASKLRAPAPLVVLLATALAACAPTKLPPLTALSPGALQKDEAKLYRQADDYERQLRTKGLIYQDRELQSYVERVGQALVPPAAGERLAFHFVVLREPTINAFALPQGGIYVHLGLLAHLENEAQLAHVLAHEITHTVNRHQLAFVHSLRNKTIAAKMADLVLVPAAVAFAGGLGGSLVSTFVGLAYAASVTGFGRNDEQEADLEGLKVIARAGYRIEEAPRVFELLNETEDPGELETFFYSDHPTNRDRARYTRELVESGTVRSVAGARTNAEAYQRAMRGARRESIRLRLMRKHYGYALAEAKAALRRHPEDPWLYYYAGEAHRLTASDPEGAAREEAMRRRKKPDAGLVASFKRRGAKEREAALRAYARALELDPALSLAHRGVGLVAFEGGDGETARRELELYLTQAEKVKDRRYIEHILEEL